MNRVTLKSNLAYVMLRQAGLVEHLQRSLQLQASAAKPPVDAGATEQEEGGSAAAAEAEASPFRVLDMFCGGGTIPLEAVATERALCSNNGGRVEAVGLDVSGGAIQGCVANTEAEGAGAHTEFTKCNAKSMRKQVNRALLPLPSVLSRSIP